jgi:hypothetical protein
MASETAAALARVEDWFSPNRDLQALLQDYLLMIRIEMSRREGDTGLASNFLR